jgi:hypothetical protein
MKTEHELRIRADRVRVGYRIQWTTDAQFADEAVVVTSVEKGHENVFFRIAFDDGDQLGVARRRSDLVRVFDVTPADDIDFQV